MRRRAFLAGTGAAAICSVAARAQPKVPIVGFVWIGSPDHESLTVVGLRKGLVERGHVFGRDLLFEERYAEGRPEHIPALITDLLAAGADMLVTPGNVATLAAYKATTTVPIVYVGYDLVGGGPVASIAHPGANVTGIDVQSDVFRVKWLDLLKSVAPNLKTVAILWDPNENPLIEKLRDPGRRFGLALTFLSARPRDLEASLAAVAARRFDGLIVNDNPALLPQMPRIVALTAESRTPALYGWTAAVKQGGLIAYSTNYFELGRLMAAFVDEILKGARPNDLPIQHPTSFDLAINLQTARTLGLDIPPTVLAAADQVIE